MWVMIMGGAKATRRMLTWANKLYNFFFIHPVQLVHEVHGSQSPVDSTDTQELCHAILLWVGERVKEYVSEQVRIWVSKNMSEWELEQVSEYL